MTSLKQKTIILSQHTEYHHVLVQYEINGSVGSVVIASKEAFDGLIGLKKLARLKDTAEFKLNQSVSSVVGFSYMGRYTSDKLDVY